MSNLFLQIFGLLGMIAVFMSRKENSIFTMKRKIIPWGVFFVGTFMVGFGFGFGFGVRRQTLLDRRRPELRDTSAHLD